MKSFWLCFAVGIFKFPLIASFPEPGKWDFNLTKESNYQTVSKTLFKESQIFIKVSCEEAYSTNILIGWTLHESPCYRDFQRFGQTFGEEPFNALDNNTIIVLQAPDEPYSCSTHINLKQFLNRSSENGTPSKSSAITSLQKLKSPPTETKRPLYIIQDRDGFYSLTVRIRDAASGSFHAKVHVEMKGKYGYLSAANWYLLPFYGSMCVLYVFLGVVWLVVSFLQWRDLLRIQFWVGGVIFLGMLEVATFYAEYSDFNATGTSLEWVVLTAEIVSCAKRTLARMLVIIVSLGFGIVKPRLGPMLHRVVFVGLIYFALAVAEAYMRVVRPKRDTANQFLLATVPLAVLDSGISWWIFISLAQTTRTLRLRRNLVKLALYRHFTNILIFAVVASVLFMLYSIKAHHLTVCFKDWKELWIDDAYWRLLFSIILIVIMILWRPTNNNQRYAFSPLLDPPDDDDDDEEEQFVNDAYDLMFSGPMQLRVKMRGQGTGAASPKPKQNSNNPDEDLKWVEENIPASLVDTTLPILDSDEEIMTTKFELSKMQ